MGNFWGAIAAVTNWPMRCLGNLALLCALLGAVLSSGVQAQEDTQPIGWTSPPGPEGTFATAYEACEAQWQEYMGGGQSRFIGSVPYTDDWRFQSCEWTSYQFLCPEETGSGINGCGTILPSVVHIQCQSGYIPTLDGYCRLNPAREQPECECPDSGQDDGKINPGVGNPILLSTGAKTLEALDYETADGQFRIGRQYRSYQVGKPIQGAVLPRTMQRGLVGGWNFDFNREIQLGTFSGSPSSPDATVAILLPDGTGYGFKLQSSGLWAEDPSGGASRSFGKLKLEYIGTLPLDLATIRDSASTWKLTDGDDTVWTLQTRNGANGGSYLLGWPTSMVMREGYQQTFTYSSDSSLASITDSFGRSASFSWDKYNISTLPTPPAGALPVPTAVDAITLPDGTSLEYKYEIIPATGAWAISGGSLTGGGVVGGQSLRFNPSPRPKRLTRVERRSASDALLDSVKYLYENATYPKLVTGIVDSRDIRISTYTYDSSARVISSKGADDTNSHVVQYGSSGSSRTRRVVGPIGKAENYTFGSFASGAADYRLTSIAGEAGADTAASTTSVGYGSDTFVSSQTDAEGNIITTTRDFRGRPLTIVEGSGTSSARSSTISWHDDFDVPVSIIRDGMTETRSYSASGQLDSVTQTDTTPHTAPYSTNGQTRTSTYTWYTNGRLESMNGPLAADGQGNDDVTSFTYDTSGNLLTSVNALGHVTAYDGYDANGRPATMTDPNGIVTAFAYDELGRITSVTVEHPTNPALHATNTITYDAIGQVIGMSMPATDPLIMDYDDAGRLTAMRTASGERIDFAYDAMGNTTRETVERSDGSTAQKITRAFDELGRLIRQTTGTGKTAQLAYDKIGNVVTSTSPNGYETTAAFDALDRVVATVAPDNGTSSMAYDERDNLTGYTDPIAVATQFIYNGFGDLIQEVSPDRGTSTYWYDAAGRMTQSSDGRGQIIDYTYDYLGRMTSKTPQGRPASEAVTYIYDSGGFSNSYDIGLLGKVIDGSGTTRFKYDHRGNTLNRRQTIGTTGNAQLVYRYDQADRITRITYPSGRLVQYGYDSKGRVSSVQTKASSAETSWTDISSNYGYEPFGAMTQMTLGNGLAMTSDWGDDGRLAARRLYKLSDDSDLSHLAYRYDADGNIGAITDLVTPANSGLYGYDEVGRLSLAVVGSATSAATQSLTYTAGTNRLDTMTDAAGTRQITYDGRGNTATETRPGGVTLVTDYDGYGRLITYNRTNASAQAYSYNGLDDRIKLVRPSGTRYFIYDADGRVMGEYGTSATDVKAEFIWALPQLAAASGPYGGSDGLGGYAPLAVAVPDTFGAVQLNWVHGSHLGVPLITSDASGNVIPPSGDYLLPGFPGQSRVFADLYYNRYRDYDPVTGRYIQADPIGLGGGSNPYSYAKGNPINLVDPDGLWALQAAGFVIGAGLEYLTNDCATASDILVAGALGAFGGGFGGYLGRKGLVGSLRGLSNTSKGRIGEGLSYAKHRLLGHRPIGNHQGIIRGYRARSDWRFQIGGRTRYIESKFGTSGLSSAQRRARDGLGDDYIVERWTYEFFGGWSRRIGGGVGIGGSRAAGGECECQ